MRYCKKCVQPDTRPGIYFDENGVCGACLWQEQREKSTGWKKRKDELMRIAENAKKKKADYDCAIGVSGGKDSVFQALYARDELGLHPLLVNAEPEGITDIGEYNFENLKQLGFDVISLRPNPRLMRELIKRDFRVHLNPVKITEHSLYASTYIIADKFDIPLVIQGENTGLTFGDSHSGLGTDGDALKANQGRTIVEGLDEYVDDGYDLRDLFMFHYDAEKLIENRTVGVWLNYYVREYSLQHNVKFAQEYGLMIRPLDSDPIELGTYNRYSQIDGLLLEVNQFLKYVKYGFGQTTDHACADVRYGLITRNEGIALVKAFDGKCGRKYIDRFCNYINIDLNEFARLTNKFRGNMWGQPPSNKWVLANPIWEQTCEWENVDVKAVIAKIREFEGDYGYEEDKLSKRAREMKCQDKRMRDCYKRNLERQKRGDETKITVSSKGIEID